MVSGCEALAQHGQSWYTCTQKHYGLLQVWLKVKLVLGTSVEIQRWKQHDEARCHNDDVPLGRGVRVELRIIGRSTGKAHKCGV